MDICQLLKESVSFYTSPLFNLHVEILLLDTLYVNGRFYLLYFHLKTVVSLTYV